MYGIRGVVPTPCPGAMMYDDSRQVIIVHGGAVPRLMQIMHHIVAHVQPADRELDMHVHLYPSLRPPEPLQVQA